MEETGQGSDALLSNHGGDESGARSWKHMERRWNSGINERRNTGTGHTLGTHEVTRTSENFTIFIQNILFVKREHTAVINSWSEKDKSWRID